MQNANHTDLMTEISLSRVLGVSNITIKYSQRALSVDFDHLANTLDIEERINTISQCVNNLVDIGQFGPLPECLLEFQISIERSEITIVKKNVDMVFGEVHKVFVF